jgi:hypothetical protein
VTAFFLPGFTGHARVTETAYLAMCTAVELDLGRRPSRRRIAQIWSRRNGVDCLTEVGRPDPVHGDTVMAIFDLGRHQPFVIARQSADGAADRVHEVVGCVAYTVLEFDP